MRLRAVLLTVTVILSACTGQQSAETTTGSPTASASATAEPTNTPTFEATPTIEATPSSGLAGMFAPDEIAVIVTTNLAVRSAPGTGADSEIYVEGYDAGLAVFVIDGPVFANGYEWYLIDPVRPRFTLGEYPAGWVAAAGKDGEAWLGPDADTCATPPAVDLVHLERQRALACYGSMQWTMEGTFGGCADTAALGPWQTSCEVYGPGVDVNATPDPNCIDVCGPFALKIRFTGNIGAQNAEPGTAIRVLGHFDDPAAQGCASDAPYTWAPPEVHACRMEFVATRVERIDG